MSAEFFAGICIGVVIGLAVSFVLSEIAWRRHAKQYKVGGTD